MQQSQGGAGLSLQPEERFAVVPEWILYADISSQAVRLYGVLARHADQHTGKAEPGRKRLATLMRVSASTIDRARQELVDIGALQENLNHRGGRRTVNTYTLLKFSREKSVHDDQLVITGDETRVITHDEARFIMGDEGRVVTGDEGSERDSSNEKEQTPSSVANDRPEIESLCSLLADEIEGNGAKRPVITKRWRDACRLMIDRDGRTPEQIEKAIRWSQGHEFWRSNILSMPKLREKYETLRLQASRSSTSNNGPGPYRNPQQEGAYEESVR